MHSPGDIWGPSITKAEGLLPRGVHVADHLGSGGVTVKIACWKRDRPDRLQPSAWKPRISHVLRHRTYSRGPLSPHRPSCAEHPTCALSCGWAPRGSPCCCSDGSPATGGPARQDPEPRVGTADDKSYILGKEASHPGTERLAGLRAASGQLRAFCPGTPCAQGRCPRGNGLAVFLPNSA